MVGAVVITIVVTAGMVSTTWVQFLKGGLLVIFSTILTVLILNRGLIVNVPEPWRDPGAILMGGELEPVGHVTALPDGQAATGPLGPLAYLRTLAKSEIQQWRADGTSTTLYRSRCLPGPRLFRIF